MPGVTRSRPTLAVLSLVAVAVLASLWPASSSLTESPSATAAPPAHVHPRGPSGALRAGTSVFDDAAAGVARLDPELLGALRRAAIDAGPVRFVVDSGWRSPAYQEQLLQEAVAKYGSEAEAARWVATPETSEHVKGAAADMGSAAAAWLSAHGAAYGLCRIYGNEPWHFELRPAAVDHGCPPMYADPTHDPRMQP
jgi:zinc D-Ala-D-Ala carboxypeptidase